MNFNLKYIAVSLLFSAYIGAQKIDINKMPSPGPTPVINIKQPKSFTLKNGLTVMVVENNKLPRASATLSMDRPPIYEGKIAGVGQLLGNQLGEGTAKTNKDNFNKRVDFLGANLSFSSNGAFANSLSKYFPEILSMMAEAITSPKFSSEELEKAKERAIEKLKTEEKSAENIANRVSNALIFGKNTSRGEFETEESIRKITVKDLENFYNLHYAPDNAHLVIVGDVKFEEIKKLVKKHFNSWKKSNTKYPALEPANNPSATEINIVDVPSAVQSVIKVGNLHEVKMNHPQYFAATIANYILGGGGESRLFMNLREKNAFTYGAYSSLSPYKYGPTFKAEFSVRNNVTDKAVVEFMNELNGISKITSEELANAKAKLKGDFIRSLEKPETIARLALNQKTQNLPNDFYTNYLKSIDKISLKDVSNAAKSIIFPKQSRIFIAGKASEISEGLEKLGYPVKYFDSNANPVAKPEAKKIDANVSISSIVDNYLSAIGGKSNIGKISSYSSEGTMSMQGQNISVKSIVAKGGKSLEVVSIGSNVLQKSVFDGKTGYVEQMGQKKELTAEEIENKQKNTEVFEEMNFVNNKDLKLSGIEKINDEDCYVIKGKNSVYYYSTKTGLKMAQSQTVKVQGQEMNIMTQLSDYKEVNGVKFPHKVTINQMGMEMPIIISSYEINKATDADFK